MLASRIETRALRPLPGASIGLSVTSSCIRGIEGVLAFREGGGGISGSAVSATKLGCSIEILEISADSSTDARMPSSSLDVEISGLGLSCDDRVVRSEDDGSTSVSSFLRFADIFASFAPGVLRVDR